MNSVDPRCCHCNHDDRNMRLLLFALWPVFLHIYLEIFYLYLIPQWLPESSNYASFCEDMSSVFCPSPDYISKFIFQLIKVLTIPDFLLSQPLWLQSPLACLYLSVEMEDVWVNQSQNTTTFFLTASLTNIFLGCSPKRHQQPSSHSLKQYFSAVEALNRFHSVYSLPRNEGILPSEVEVKDLLNRIFYQMFPFPSYYLFEFIMANPWWKQMSKNRTKLSYKSSRPFFQVTPLRHHQHCR